MERKFRWIDESIDISHVYDKFSKVLQNLIKDAEQADLDCDEVLYERICENIEVQAKLHIPDVISRDEWLRICDKYWFNE